MVNRKYFILVFIILFAAGSVFSAQDQQIQQKLAQLEKLPARFSFVVTGDNRSGDDTYKKLVSIAVDRKPDFIINTGDMITTPGNLEQWAAFWEMSKPIKVPYFLTVGNHDIDSRIASTQKVYVEQVDLPGNELYYSFIAGNSLFVILDSCQDYRKITGDQLKWLEGVLKNSSAKHKFVFVHHPLYPEKNRGKHHGNSLDRYPKERDDLQALFVKHKVTMVFTGHEHLYLRKNIDGITHVITGGGGAPLYASEIEGGFNHFVQVTVDNDKVNAQVVDIDGKMRDKF
jgi:predicted MPP superfamily phosphohydrolase